MSDVAIRVENLSKLYRIGQFVGYSTLRESLVNTFSAPFRRFRSTIAGQRTSSRNQDSEYIWALKDISFEIKQGEVVGIIGRNGAGKTTLLKVLTRITTPTQGYAEIRGRAGSLLEVGTGFHPELTGRENIYLNGAVLGMKKKEIDSKFDEIVEFAGVEKFIDTPLKRYSSGMQVRLAFSVAAHMEPEILLVDEVLAVGDAEFQKKCLSKMGEMAGGGRTVLFVSHNMITIRRLCQNSILLTRGQFEFRGPTNECIARYLGNSTNDSVTEVNTMLLERPGGLGTSFRFSRVGLLSASGPNIHLNERFGVELQFQCLERLRNVALGISIDTGDGIRVLECRSTDARLSIEVLSPGNYTVRVTLENNLLMPGYYTVSVGAGSDADGRAIDLVQNVIGFRVLPLDIEGTASLEPKQGFLHLESKWTEPLRHT